MGLSRRQFLKLCGAGAIGIGMFSFDCFANPQRGGLEGVFRIDENIIETIESNLESSKSVTHYAYKLLKNNGGLRFHNVDKMERMVHNAESNFMNHKQTNYILGISERDRAIVATYFLSRELHNEFNFRKDAFSCLDFALPYFFLAKRLNIPIFPVKSLGHLFLRIDFDGKHDASDSSAFFNKEDMNFDPTFLPKNKVQINGNSDQYFINKDKISFDIEEEVVYLRNLSPLELIGDVFNTLGFDFSSKLLQYDNAIRCFISALNLFPGLPDAYNNLGVAFSKRNNQGDSDKAIKCLNRAIELYPSFEGAKENLRKVTRDLNLAYQKNVK